MRHLFIAAIVFTAALSAQTNLASNPGFEKPLNQGWSLFIPGDAKDKGCTLTNVSGRTGTGAQIEASQAARYGLASGIKVSNVGERYRITAWVKADAAAEAQGDNPGVTIRVIFSDPKGKDISMGFAVADGRAFKDPIKMESSKVPLPKVWTRLEIVMEVPAGATTLNYNLFSWRSKGKIIWDDVSVSPVGKDVPLSTLL